ncbi:MAG: hypothetical protein WDN49_16385 [Acetobacteraceae bacterium]
MTPIREHPLLAERFRRAGPWFALFTILLLCGEGLSYAAWGLADTALPDPFAWLLGFVVALMVGAVGTLLLDWLVLDNQRRLAREADDLRADAQARPRLEAALANRIEAQRRLRHDLRGVLSPALLTADRLLNNTDPVVKRAGEMMVVAVERATALLAEDVDSTKAPSEKVNPPARP